MDDLLMEVRHTPSIPRGQTVEWRALFQAGTFRTSTREALFQAGTFPSSCVHCKCQFNFVQKVENNFVQFSAFFRLAIKECALVLQPVRRPFDGYNG